VTETTLHVPVPNANLWTIRSGHGPPLVLRHGGPGMPNYLGPLAALLLIASASVELDYLPVM
jgi:hypothetical protein